MTPTPEFQLAFLSKLQRLFTEGDFAATYKYALLISFADIAVESGGDDNNPQRIAHQALATKFVELYWQQAAPYASGIPTARAGLLAQNKGTQAAVITAIIKFRQDHPNVTAQSAPAKNGYTDMVRSVTKTVASQPVNYLQNLGGTTDSFIFEREAGHVVLKPGVAFCLRRVQPLIQQLARSHWVEHIKGNKLNHTILGSSDDLESFLFHTSRRALQIIGSGLMLLSNCKCFYCEGKVQEADVDHFIPFAMYPRDLAHNFVLAHPACNRSKSHTLAALPHLERWLRYIAQNDAALQEIGATAGRVADSSSCHAVAKWGYTNAFAGGAQAWMRSALYEPVTSKYVKVFA